MGVAVKTSDFLQTTAAEFRRWVGAYIDALDTAGLVRTSTPGQFDPLTTAAPTAASQWVTHAVWYLDDSLHGSAPLYVRLDFGSTSTGATTPRVMLTVGRGVDAVGAVTGVLFSSPIGKSATTTPNAVYRTHYASVGEGYAVFAPNTDNPSISYTTEFPAFFGIERTRNHLGQITGDGIVVLYINISNNSSIASETGTGWLPAVRAIAYGSGAWHETEVPVVGIASFNGTPPGPSTSMAAGGIGPVFPWVLFAPGVAPWQACAMVSIPHGDYPGADFQATLCGTARTYRPIPISTSPTLGWNRQFGHATSHASSPTRYGWFGLCILWEP